MKKCIAAILGLIMLTSFSYAKVGDVAGMIFSSDIKAYINGVEVKSYNIGGKTAVVVEDSFKSHSFVYNDSQRMLKIFSVSPNSIQEGENENVKAPGKVVGNIFETDIKTTIYGKDIPSYNIGGKTAFVIEDVAGDKEFSRFGGKFVWDEAARTISLEFMYDSPKFLSNDKNIIITANEDMTEMNATFEEALHCGGYQEYFKFPDSVTEDADIDVILPIKAQNEIIGHYFRTPSKDNKFTAFTYYYPEKVEEAQKNYTPDPNNTREDIISHFINFHCVGEPRERFDTDDYTFVYISVAGTSWTSYNLVQAWDDGTYIDYGKEISMQNRSPQGLVIDKENEKVTFKYVDRYNSEWYTNYEIDLKTGKISELEKVEE